MSLALYFILGILLLSFILLLAIPFPNPFKGEDLQEKDTKDLLKAVRKIEIKTKGLSNTVFSGEYHSAFKGRGMSFSEVREYQYGDDVRNIDWNVTARFSSPYIKVYEEERELTVMLLIDVSQSSFFGTKGQMKNELITEFSAVIAFSAINNNDKIGVIFFSDKIERFIPPKKGRSHVLRIIRELLDFEAVNTETNIEQALRYCSNVNKKKSITFLISDFLDEGYEQALNLTARRHDLIGVHIADPWEFDMPNLGMLRAKDAETGESVWLDTSSKTNRNTQTKYYQENYEKCKNAFRKSGADLMSIRTDRPYAKTLMNFFKKRGG